jgi:hypothetical protein
LLAPEDLAEVVDDPHETAHLAGLRSGLVVPEPTGPAARQVARRLFVAQDRDEAEWIRAGLSLSLDEARAHRPLPGQDGTAAPAAPGEPGAFREPGEPGGLGGPGDPRGPGTPDRLARMSGVRCWLHRGIRRTATKNRGSRRDPERGAAEEAGRR